MAYDTTERIGCLTRCERTLLAWDNGSFAGNGENFGLLDRKTSTIATPEIVQAIMLHGGWDNLPQAN